MAHSPVRPGRSRSSPSSNPVNLPSDDDSPPRTVPDVMHEPQRALLPTAVATTLVLGHPTN